ncbi:MAG: hypothetical protein ACI94Y_002406 [Maribacter sp.]|jgi:hypothetical protein
MPKPKPYISFIFTGRNDDYGGDFNTRINLSVNWLTYLIEKHQLPSELIIVNYNPIESKPGLEELIERARDRKYLRVRMITVPNAVHQTLVDTEIRKTIPLFEFCAKNIAIRRAEGEFAFCTNADVLISEALVQYLATRQLKEGILYRCDRMDFKSSPAIQASVLNEELEANIRKSIFKFFVQGGTKTKTFPSSVELRRKLSRWFLRIEEKKYRLKHFLLRNRFYKGTFKNDMFVYEHHGNASGDMGLMSMKDWMRTRGYLENTWISTHTDTLHVLNAAASGLEVKVLDYPIYHQDHERRFDFDGVNPDMERMYIRLVTEGNLVLKGKMSGMNPNENWGLPEHQFQEMDL